MKLPLGAIVHGWRIGPVGVALENGSERVIEN
jgi:hypothetical protein